MIKVRKSETNIATPLKIEEHKLPIEVLKFRRAFSPLTLVAYKETPGQSHSNKATLDRTLRRNAFKKQTASPKVHLSKAVSASDLHFQCTNMFPQEENDLQKQFHKQHSRSPEILKQFHKQQNLLLQRKTQKSPKNFKQLLVQPQKPLQSSQQQQPQTLVHQKLTLKLQNISEPQWINIRCGDNTHRQHRKDHRSPKIERPVFDNTNSNKFFKPEQVHTKPSNDTLPRHKLAKGLSYDESSAEERTRTKFLQTQTIDRRLLNKNKRIENLKKFMKASETLQIPPNLKIKKRGGLVRGEFKSESDLKQISSQKPPDLPPRNNPFKKSYVRKVMLQRDDFEGFRLDHSKIDFKQGAISCHARDFPYIYSISANSKLHQANVYVGDHVVKLNGRSVEGWSRLRFVENLNQEKKFVLMFATLDKSPPCTESENPKQLFSSTSTPSASTFPRKSLHRSRSSDTLAHESQYEEIKCFEHGTEVKKKESKDLKQRVERMSDSSRNDRKEKKEILKRENSNLSDSYRNKLQAATWGGKIGRKSEEEVEMRKKVEKMQTTEKISSDQSKNLFLFDAFADLAEKEKAVMNSTRNSKVDENNNAINCSVMSSTPSSKKTTCHNKPPNSPSTTTNTSMPLKRVISSNSSGFVSEENTSDGSVPSYTSTGSCDGVFYPKVENNLDKRKSSDEIQTRFSKGFNKLEILEKQLQRNLKEQEYLEKQHTLLRQASFPQFGELNKTSLDEDVHLNVRQPHEVLNRPTRPDKPPPLPPKSYNKTNNTVTPKTEYYNKKNKLSLCNQSSSYQVGDSANEHGSRTQLNVVKESLVRSATSPEVFNISRTDILNHDDFSPQITYPQDRFFSPHKNAPINNFTNHVIVVNVNQESLYDNNNGSRNSNSNNNSHNSSFHFEDSRTFNERLEGAEIVFETGINGCYKNENQTRIQHKKPSVDVNLKDFHVFSNTSNTSSISTPSHMPLQSPSSQILHSTFAPPSPILPPSLSHPHFSSSGSRRPSLPPLHEKSFKSSRTSEFDDEEYKKPKSTSRVHNGEDVQQSNAFNGLTKQDDYEENTAPSSSERVPNVSSHLKAPPLPPKMLRTTKSEASLRAKMQINEEKNILRKENIDKSDKVEEEEINIETNVSRPNEKKTSEKGGDEGVEGMGVEDVCEWLKAISFTSFLKEFRSRRVDGVELFQLKRHHLVAMGMHSLETRRDFERALMKLKKNL